MCRETYEEKIYVLFRSVCMKARLVIAEGLVRVRFNIFSYEVSKYFICDI